MSVAFGMTIFTLASYNAILAMEYQNWKSTQAQLEYFVYQSASSPTTAAANNWGSDYAKVKYTYSVGDKQYTGNNVMPLESVFLSRKFVKPLSPGEISIQYNPKDPELSFIYVTFPATQLAMMYFASLVLLLVGALAPRIWRFTLSYFLMGRHDDI